MSCRGEGLDHSYAHGWQKRKSGFDHEIDAKGIQHRCISLKKSPAVIKNV